MTTPTGDAGVTRTESLKALILRVQAAKEADRALDEAIMAAFYVRDRRHIGARDYYTNERVTEDVWADPRTDRFVTNQVFEFTAEPRHHERLVGFLPGDCWQISTRSPDPTTSGFSSRAWAKIAPCLGNAEGQMVGARDCMAPTVALALTAAALMIHVSALIARSEEADHAE
ncbi:hypothetical protein HNR00_003524 [Methylorubrum rhodinum]|uniref:Uncharacterized protein n=1 Tax=Methylorubrum rhodinum TaxID=29428 RepID=A0A840ZPJ6_9HYPH|nr:hypothetical protein [Methylorubrum rhodinum]MBB5758797.1 hypothetical protein [Methylorubrum rhodinum]